MEIYFAQIGPIDWDVFDKTIITSALSCHGLNWNGNKDTYLNDIQITALKKSQNFYYSKHNLTFRISPMKMNSKWRNYTPLKDVHALYPHWS